MATIFKIPRSVSFVTWLGIIVNLFLTLLKFFAGVTANSQVLVADAVHSFSDLSTDIAILVGVRFWNRPADEDHQYGHAKIESLVTLFIGLVLVAVGIGLACDAVQTIHALLMGKTLPMPGKLAFLAALISILLKEWLYRITLYVGKDLGSSALHANAWHHRSDALSSIPAALTVLSCLVLGDKYVFLDPVGTILVSAMIVYTAVCISWPALSTLLDRGVSLKKVNEIREMVLAEPPVRNVHKIRTRPLGSGKFVVDLHIHVDPFMSVRDAHRLSHAIQKKLCSETGEIADVVVHVEPASPESENTDNPASLP